MPRFTLPNVLIAAIIATVILLLVLQKNGVWAVRHQAETPPPTPAALAFRAGEAEAAARAARAREQAAQPAALGTPAEDASVLPAGTGRDETFGACTPCHSTAIIRRTALPRAQWDGLMDWMVEKHGMHPLAVELRATIVDYLGNHFGPRESPRGRNPFQN